MKNILLILAIAFSSASFAQGNLQFNQVLNLTYTNNFTNFGNATVGSITVPVGKIWKIESGSSHTFVSGPNKPYPVGMSLFLGDFCVISVESGNYGSVVNYPIWLSAGVYSVVMNAYQTSGNLKCALSVIEFNIVP